VDPVYSLRGVPLIGRRVAKVEPAAVLCGLILASVVPRARPDPAVNMGYASDLDRGGDVSGDGVRHLC
jgi:hypothetical protein